MAAKMLYYNFKDKITQMVNINFKYLLTFYREKRHYRRKRVIQQGLTIKRMQMDLQIPRENAVDSE
jgi:hypothetical protein